MGIKKDIFNLLCINYNGSAEKIGQFETEEAAHDKANGIISKEGVIEKGLTFLVVHYSKNAPATL